MKQKVKRLFTQDVAVNKNNNLPKIELISEKMADYSTVKIVVYGVNNEEN